MRAMIAKEFRELRRDHRTLGMLIMMPLLLLVVFGYAANFNVSSVQTAVLGANPAKVTGQLPPLFDVTEQVTGTSEAALREQAEQLIRDNHVDVAVLPAPCVATADCGTGPIGTVLIDGSNLFAAQAAVSVVNRFGEQLQTEVLFNPELKTSWVMIPAIIGLILTFIGTIVTSIGMVRERETGTLEQLAVMPIKPSAVILGKIAPYFMLAALDMTIVTVLGMLLFDVPFNGDPAVFALGAALFLFVVLGLGVFISTISKTTGQAIQTAFFFLMPQILLSGMIFPLAAIPWGVRWISYLLPLTYFTMVSQGVMIRGAALGSLWLPLVALAIMAGLIFTGAVLRFRRDLAPGERRRSPGAAASVDQPA
ncbi:MAG: ABC transporter permease [Candidatus Nanopelagicales bacterium]